MAAEALVPCVAWKLHLGPIGPWYRLFSRRQTLQFHCPCPFRTNIWTTYLSWRYTMGPLHYYSTNYGILTRWMATKQTIILPWRSNGCWKMSSHTVECALPCSYQSFVFQCVWYTISIRVASLADFPSASDVTQAYAGKIDLKQIATQHKEAPTMCIIHGM